MNATAYYRHARALGPFPAAEALALAREAAALDEAAAAKRRPGPVVVWHETLPDGTAPLRFSNGVTVY